MEQSVLAEDVEVCPVVSGGPGLQAAMALALRPRRRPATDLVDECDRQGDRWGACRLALRWGGMSAANQSEPGNDCCVAETGRELAAPVLSRGTGTAIGRDPSNLSVKAPTSGAGEPGLPGRFDCGRRWAVPWRRLRTRAQSLLMLLALHRVGVAREI